MELTNLSSEEYAEFLKQSSPAPEVTPEPKTEEPAPVAVEPQETPVEEPTEISEELQGFYSQFGEKLFNEDLLLPFQDENGEGHLIPKSIDDIAELVRANKDRWIEESRTNDKEALLQEIFQSSSPAFQFIAQNAHHFNSPQELIPLIQSVQAQDYVAELSLEDENDQAEIIRQALLIQGLDSQTIEDDIQDLKERGRLEERATRLKPTLDKFNQDRTQQILEQQAQVNHQNQVFWNNYYGLLNQDLLSASDIDGMNLTKEDRVAVAQTLVPNQQTGEIPIISIIDELISNGDIKTLAQISLIAQNKDVFDQYYGSKKATQVAKGLQKVLKTNLKSSSTQETVVEPKQSTKSLNNLGWGNFL